MAIELIAKIKPKNGGSFAMVDACDVEMPDGTRLSDSCGLSDTAKTLLITILRAAEYSDDQTANIEALERELGKDELTPIDPPPPSGSGPDEPETPKLATPKIYLETVTDPGGDEPDETTPAILGVAVLGRTILGNYESDLPKLTAPVIRLETVTDNVKLATPVIRLETVTESDEPDEPEEPELPKLTAPEIYLEVVNPEEPKTPKLEAPTIYIYEEIHTHRYTSVDIDPTCTEKGYSEHTCGDCGDSYVDSYINALGHDWSEPYYSSEFTSGYGRKCNRCGELETMLPKLTAPVIRLETVVEPEPEVLKLNTPSIELVKWTNARINGDYVEWDKVASGVSYNVCVYENGTRVYVVGTSATEYLLTKAGLESGKTYTVIVKIGDKVASDELTYVAP